MNTKIYINHKTILGPRYTNNQTTVKKLNSVQVKTKDKIIRNFETGFYELESPACCVCRNNNFDLLSRKDRYGLPLSVVICTKCGLIQTNPRMTQKSYNHFYKNNYQKLHKGRMGLSEVFFSSQYKRGKSIYSFIEGFGLLPKYKPYALEIGSGAGGILKYFRDFGFRVKGLDLGEEYLELGKTKYNLNLSVGTIADVTSKKPPNLLIYSHVFEHILDPKKELSLVNKLLQKDSLVYIEVPGAKNLQKNNQSDFLRYLQLPHVYHFSFTTIRNLLETSGFELIYADEEIRSVWRKSRTSARKYSINSDYRSAISYLKRSEKKRLAYRIKKIPNYLVSIIKSSKFKNIFRKIK